MTLVPFDLHRDLDPARLIDRAALPRANGADLMAMADIEKLTANKRDWRDCRRIQRRDFHGAFPQAKGKSR